MYVTLLHFPFLSRYAFDLLHNQINLNFLFPKKMSTWQKKNWFFVN